MRLGIVYLLITAFGGGAFADALLSVNAAAGPQQCVQSSAASASCNASASVYVPAGQFYSPVWAGGNFSFGPTAAPDGLGPATIGTLDYTLQGNWNMGQGIAVAGQAQMSLTATIDLPSDSGNWIFYGSSSDSTDDNGGLVESIQIVTSGGDGAISGSLSQFEIDHTPGDPFSVTLNVSDTVEEAESSNNFNFELRMVDPVSTPEPGTWTLLLAGLPILFLLKRPE
jgi:hypothetical protein